MKLKQKDEDFKVEETTTIGISKEPKAYKVYSLEKRGIESFFLFSYLAKSSGFDVRDIGYAGLKDKHALTRQYLTIPADKAFSILHEKGFDLTFLGYSDTRIELGSLEGNRFEITVRNIRKGEFEGITKKSAGIEKAGVPNYFDSQRFGSAIYGEFVVKHVIRGDFEGAVKAYLTTYTKSEPSKVKTEKRLILENWKDLKAVNATKSNLAAVIEEYKTTSDWKAAYRRIPTNIRKLFVSSYQSYIWNECVKILLKKALFHDQVYKIDYSAGDLIFYKDIKQAQLDSLPKTLKLVGPQMELAEAEEKVIGQVLNKEGIKLRGLDIEKDTGDYFGVRERQVIVFPKGFTIGEPEVDELNDSGKKNVFKIKLSFSLPKGSYATIVTKRVFNR